MSTDTATTTPKSGRPPRPIDLEAMADPDVRACESIFALSIARAEAGHQ